MSSTEPRPLFSQRYGLAKWHDPRRIPGWEPPIWAMRHSTAPKDDSEPQHGCVCPGVSLGCGNCHQSATQEDFLCDECRNWCVAIDAAGNYHQLASVAAASGGPS